jgi:UDP-N-acetylbacillosamine transaminase
MQLSEVQSFLRDTYGDSPTLPLHEPRFVGNEQRYVSETIESTFVSSVGRFVDRFEQTLSSYTGSPFAVATSTGSSALQIALMVCGVRPGDMVILPSMTFVACCNVVHHLGAQPLLADVSTTTLGLCPDAVRRVLEERAYVDDDGVCRDRHSGSPIRAVVPMHTFGHPVDMQAFEPICQQWRLEMVEDAAESLGSFYGERHTGTLSRVGAISFNGNKIVTTGGGGVMLFRDESDAKLAKHLSTTAKVQQAYEFVHDQPAFNFRMPNLNAALGCAQMEQLGRFVTAKRELAAAYRDLFDRSQFEFVVEPEGVRSNYWLNAVVCENRDARDELLAFTNERGIQTRPVWVPMHQLSMYSGCARGDMKNTNFLADRLVNLPSSVPLRAIS